jgi:hypothetical protein
LRKAIGRDVAVCRTWSGFDPAIGNIGSDQPRGNPNRTSKINDAVIVPSVIPARIYEGQTKDVETAAIVNFLVTREGVSTDTVYAMTRALFQQL